MTDASVSLRNKYIRNVYFLLFSRISVDPLRVCWDSCVILGNVAAEGDSKLQQL